MLNYSHSIMVLQEENVKQKSYFTPATKKKKKQESLHTQNLHKIGRTEVEK